MKKLILSMVMVAAFAAIADETYQALYWQVTADSLGEYATGASYANLYATINDSTVSVPSSPANASGFVELNRTGGGTLDDGLNTWAVNLSGWNGGSSLDGAMFFVELFNEGGSIAKSEGISYANLKSYLDMNYSGSGVPKTATGAAVFSGYAAVPEPTSGLLMLLGIAGLALRRKRA